MLHNVHVPKGKRINSLSRKAILSAARSFRVPSELTSDVIEEFFQSLGCSRALSALILFRNGEHEQLAGLEFNPLDYPDHGPSIADAYAATSFLSKFKGLSLPYDLKQVAMAKFEEFELHCKHINRRFRNLAHEPLFTGRAVWLHNAVVRKIASILGEVNTDHFFSFANWGPGATTLLKASDASASNKFHSECGITRDLYDLLTPGGLPILGEYYPLWWERLRFNGFPLFQTGNKVVTVPKNAKTDRVIAIEPGINLWFQKAIGDMIGRRLLRCGVDLTDQTLNQSAAYRSSIDDRAYTIDFSSASDSISRVLVRELLPPHWHSLLDACRSHYGTLGSSSVLWEKFSSMGNGFTFQLESLIFYAVAFAAAEYSSCSTREISVYGDDVIIPRDSKDPFLEMCNLYGFIVNQKKSCFTSGFRESCGAHFFRGVNITPYYLKDSISDLQSVYKTANGIRRYAHRRGFLRWCDDRYRKAVSYLVNRCPRALRLRISNQLGDGGFISNQDEATPVRAKHQIEGFDVMHFQDVGITYESVDEGVLLARLRSGDVGRPEHNSVPVRGRTRLKLHKSLVHQWYNLGPWL